MTEIKQVLSFYNYHALLGWSVQLDVSRPTNSPNPPILPCMKLNFGDALGFEGTTAR